MSEPQMTKEQILFELFEGKNGYIQNPKRRAIGLDGICKYQAEDGNQCAVGRCLLSKWRNSFALTATGVFGLVNYVKRARLGNPNAVSSIYLDATQEDFDAMFLKRYRGHGKYFWGVLQHFHDNNFYWNEEGLTELGKKFLERIKTSFKATDVEAALHDLYYEY